MIPRLPNNCNRFSTNEAANCSATRLARKCLVHWKIVGNGPLVGALRRGKWAGELTSRLRAEHGQKRPALWTVAVESDSAIDCAREVW